MLSLADDVLDKALALLFSAITGLEDDSSLDGGTPLARLLQKQPHSTSYCRPFTLTFKRARCTFVVNPMNYSQYTSFPMNTFNKFSLKYVSYRKVFRGIMLPQT